MRDAIAMACIILTVYGFPAVLGFATRKAR